MTANTVLYVVADGVVALTLNRPNKLNAFGRNMRETLTGTIDAEPALDWGLIWAVADDNDLMEEAGAIARRLAEGPSLALSLIKKAIIASEHNTLSEQLDMARDFQRITGVSEDFQEGISAFVAKRRPSFKEN